MYPMGNNCDGNGSSRVIIGAGNPSTLLSQRLGWIRVASRFRVPKRNLLNMFD